MIACFQGFGRLVQGTAGMAGIGFGPWLEKVVLPDAFFPGISEAGHGVPDGAPTGRPGKQPGNNRLLQPGSRRWTGEGRDFQPMFLPVGSLQKLSPPQFGPGMGRAGEKPFRFQIGAEAGKEYAVAVLGHPIVAAFAS